QQEGKVLVFVTHHQTTDRLMKALTEEKIKVDYIDGRVNGADREVVKERFQSGDLEILICGIRAASEGLTLTASHTVIMFEFDWNPGKMHQAE
ncbi:SWF/SNF helicase family protein, partial [Klebsiella pneumoniae]|nr:SWF/SNF helicase family protein [Klebsiella pneumoniae]